MGDCTAWVAFYWNDYIGKTMGLRPVEHGIYILLLANYYIQGGPLPADMKRLELTCSVRTKSERQSLSNILQRFFVQDGDKYRHKRADEELAKRLEISEKRRNAANTRYANAPANAPASADQKHTQPQPQPQEEKILVRQKTRTQLPKDFVPNDTNKRIAKELNINLTDVLQAFKDFHESKGNVMKDWHLALNTWLRNERRFGPKKEPAKQQTTGSLTENYRQLREKYQ